MAFEAKLSAHVEDSSSSDDPEDPHTVYNIRVTYSGKEWCIPHRFRHFDELRQKLVRCKLEDLPHLPPKTWFGRRMDPKFIKERCNDLDNFLQELLMFDDVVENKYFLNFLSIEKNMVSGAEISTKLGIDDFELIESIGKGSFGTVLQVVKKDTKKVYAMKVLKKKDLIKRGQVAHTWTERTVLADIDHPFIVSLRFAFQTKEKLFMVLDFFTGGELFYHLRKARRFSEERTIFYVAEVLLALEHLHNNDILYRDLKPENLLLDRDGHIRLTDFGLSKDFDPEQKKLTRTFCGTPEYIAPEVIRRQPYGFFIDWWSLGILTFELLAGKPPFQDSNPKVMYEKILHEKIPYPSFFSRLSKQFIMATLQRNPKKRLGTVGDAEEVKEHAFFETIDWDALLARKVEPEFIPSVEDDSDTRNVDDHVKEELPRITPESEGLAGGEFLDFTFHRASPSSMAKTSPAIIPKRSPIIIPGRESSPAMFPMRGSSIGNFFLGSTQLNSIEHKMKKLAPPTIHKDVG